MRKAIKIALILSSGILASCQTTANTAANIDPTEADLALHVMGEVCVMNSMRGAHTRNRQLKLPQATVMSIESRHDGWRAADVAYKGFRDNIYFNKETAMVICGGKNWTAFTSSTAGEHGVRSKTLQKLPDYVATANIMDRSIAVSWEGYDTLFAGTIHELSNGANGTVAIVLPDNKGTCRGTYQTKTRTQGTWSISCTNGLAADGIFTVFGSGKGASGTGFDKLGRKVTYTMGGKT
jgi:hypothetical protein